MEKALRESEERLRLAQSIAHVGIWDWNPRTGSLTFTPEFDQLYGTPSGAMKTYDDWRGRVHADDIAKIEAARDEAVAGHRQFDLEFRIRHESGETRWISATGGAYYDDTGEAVRVFGVNRDITERKRSEENLAQAQKLESLGLLAGGVAHDFNNLLVGVIGNASLAQELLPRNHPAADLLERVVRTGEQAAHLTRQMLAYSGKGRFVVELINLSDLVPDMSSLVQPSISKKTSLHFELDPNLPLIEADKGQIQQVLMNLVLNAAEAIGSSTGLVSVKTGVQDVNDQYASLNLGAAELRPGRYVLLEVRDTGCGMDEATKARVFDPFFSTKFTGRGLGLAAVAGIVRGHKGVVHVASEPQKGSCFTVLLPASEHGAPQTTAETRTPAVRGSGIVLVVDDEEVVRDMAKRALERHGFEVLTAESGAAAIDVLKREPRPVSLVLLDWSMPGMGGDEVLPEIYKIQPEVKVVVSSGYAESETMKMFQGHRVSGFIQKPYRSAILAEKIKATIER